MKPNGAIWANQFDNVATSFTGNVTVAIGTNPAPGTGVLSGTLTQPAALGVATFNDLKIDKPNNGYTLTAATPVAGVAIEAGEELSKILGELEQKRTEWLNSRPVRAWTDEAGLPSSAMKYQRPNPLLPHWGVKT